MSTYSLDLSKPAFTLGLPPTLYVSGGWIRGELELDYQAVLEEEIDCVRVVLRGATKTKNRMGAELEEFKVNSTDFLTIPLQLWTYTECSPPVDGTHVRLPFELQIPVDAPSSFGFESYMHNAYVRYSLEVTGVRKGLFVLDEAVKVPIVVIQPDPLGSLIRTQLKLGWPYEWGRLKVNRKIRKLPWGDYSMAKMELLVPHMNVFPLFTDIPYTIIVTTVSAPVKRKGTGLPPKDLFPPVPRSPYEMDFELRRFVDMDTPQKPSYPEELVADIISKAHASFPPMDTEICEPIWLPDTGRAHRGRWKQEVMFHSSMNLRCTPSFATEGMEIKYTLTLKLDFPGLGNALRITLPITIGSGVEAPVPNDEHSLCPRTVDLPLSYWNVCAWSDE